MNPWHYDNEDELEDGVVGLYPDQNQVSINPTMPYPFDMEHGNGETFEQMSSRVHAEIAGDVSNLS